MHTFVVQGDCLDVLRTFPDASISAVVTDPPYGLSKEPDMLEVLRHWLNDGETYRHKGGGFMGKTWDSFVPGPEVWREVLRVLKPGGHALVFSGTRTYDLTVLAMRIAGFEIRDQLAWLYGSGFPKSLDVSKAIDAAAGVVREVVGRSPWDARKPNGSASAVACGLNATPGGGDITAPATPEAERWHGWGTALKPAQEPIVLARKPLDGTVAANVLEHGTGGINVDGCRIGSGGQAQWTSPRGGIWRTDSDADAPIQANALGRWPANVLLDETAAEMLDEQTGTLAARGNKTAKDNGADYDASSYAFGGLERANPLHNIAGGASRFFYVAKTSRAEREAGLDRLPRHTAGELTDRTEGSDGLNSPRAGAGRTSQGRANNHPTVKPIALMRHLVRLITPPGGMVLDPYCGSGSTLCAAVLEGVSSVGIELTPEYIPIIEGRVEHHKLIAAKAAAVEQLAGADARARFEGDQ